MTLGQYVPGNSIVHKTDPRVKIFLSVFYMVALFMIDSLWMFIPMFIFALIVVKIAGLSFLSILKSLKSILFILIFTTLIHAFTTAGREAFNIFGLSISYEGLEMALYVAVRLGLLVIGTSILTLSTSTTKLTDGLESLMAPLKIIKFPAHE
ncbi:energy-coupling factor transporter transmembrane component T family protein, partial [Rhodovulum adriaticum]|uniref:energy-coupling factor transporter transmembrane component T family protein n=1 Tax=Rhodovulum adriaticum TaxID=35804 RepID=UPI001A921DDE